MNHQKLVELLQGTIDPHNRQTAEDELKQVHKIIGFSPALLQIVVSNEIGLPIRQAGVIYIKNMISQNWQEREASHDEPLPFHIHEKDRAAIRDNIIDAIMVAPDILRVQLCVCMGSILKHDFPGRWPTVAEKIRIYLQSDNPQAWTGGLMVLYQLVKNYEYKKVSECGPRDEAMALFLPVMYERIVQLLPDQSQWSVVIQKLTLKIFYAVVQYSYPLNLINKDMLAQWLAVFLTILDQPIPVHVNQEDEDDRCDMVWWKLKKWAIHILDRVFERYGSPGHVISKEYEKFADYYLKTHSAPVLKVLLKILDENRRKIYVAPRVLQQTLNYLNQSVKHAVCWNILKQHMQAVIQEVLFPIMCHTDSDDELWKEDPYEYVRLKFDVFEEFLSPVTAAQTLLHTSASKRKQILPATLQFCVSVLANPESNPRNKDGALHMIGSLSDVLMKKKSYKDQVETMLVSHVYPEFNSSEGYMRARACWVLHSFAEVKFKDDQTLLQAVEFIHRCLKTDKEIPVKVEAAIALQSLIDYQDKVKTILEPHVTPLIEELLNLIRATENDDLNGVIQKLICEYTDQVATLSVQITQHLAETFTKVIDGETEDNMDDKAMTAMGILNTIETILSVMEEHKDIMVQLEAIVLNVVGVILHRNIMEFYEEVLSLVYSLTCTNVSPHMWQVFHLIYEMFKQDGFDYFTDIMPALHNYITVDTPTFLRDSRHLEVIYDICKTVLTNPDSGEDFECHAAKLLEVILLQCKEQVDQCVPTFVQLVLERLTREVKTSELRTMCLQVVIAALYYNPQLLLSTLDSAAIPNSNQSVTGQFISQWLMDTDSFLGLHDRKVCVLGLCTLISSIGQRHAAINGCAQQIIPSLLLLFSGLKRAYATRAAAENADSDDSDGEAEESEDEEALDSDEDHIDDEVHLHDLNNLVGDDEDDDDDENDEFLDETPLETYVTPLDLDDCLVDEYIIFKDILLNVQSHDPEWYSSLIGHLSEEQQNELTDVMKLADQRKAAAESKRIEKTGGYQFNQITVPMNFNFGQ